MKTKTQKKHLNKKNNLPTNCQQSKDLKKKTINKKLKHVDKQKEGGKVNKKKQKKVNKEGRKKKKKRIKKRKEKKRKILNNY